MAILKLSGEVKRDWRRLVEDYAHRYMIEKRRLVKMVPAYCDGDTVGHPSLTDVDEEDFNYWLIDKLNRLRNRLWEPKKEQTDEPKV